MATQSSAAKFRRNEGVDDQQTVRDLAQQRFARAVMMQNNALSGAAGQKTVTAGDEPMIIDLDGPVRGQHWIVWALSALGVFVTRTIAGTVFPTTGLFMVPTGTPIENQGDTTAANFWLPQARGGIALQAAMFSQPIAARFAFLCQWQGTGGGLVVPSGWTLRFIANVAPATATPGPGAGSSGTLAALVTPEDDA